MKGTEMNNQEILNHRYMRECQSFTDAQAKVIYKHGVFDWHSYTIMINDRIVEKIKAETDQAAQNAVTHMFNLEVGDYVKVVKVITTYETTYENYQEK
jgi:hypothetical protein